MEINSVEQTSTESINLINDNTTNSGMTSLKDLNIGNGNNLTSILGNMSMRSTAIATGIAILDNVLQGGIRAGLTIVTGKPGEGKTTLCLNLAEQFSKSGHQVLYFCNDMPLVDVVAKGLSRNSYLVAMENGFSTAEILHHNENGLKDNETFIKTCENYRNNTSNLRILDIADSLRIEDISKIIADYVITEKEQPIIIIDYLQKIVVSSVNSDKEKLDFLVEQLKAIAMTNNLPIIALSSINRMSYRRELSMDSLKESGSIEFNADLILGIQQQGIGDQFFDINKVKSKGIWEMELVILKNRMGQSDVKLKVNFYPKYNLLPYYASEKVIKKVKKTSDFLNT